MLVYFLNGALVTIFHEFNTHGQHTYLLQDIIMTSLLIWETFSYCRFGFWLLYLFCMGNNMVMTIIMICHSCDSTQLGNLVEIQKSSIVIDPIIIDIAFALHFLKLFTHFLLFLLISKPSLLTVFRIHDQQIQKAKTKGMQKFFVRWLYNFTYQNHTHQFYCYDYFYSTHCHLQLCTHSIYWSMENDGEGGEIHDFFGNRGEASSSLQTFLYFPQRKMST